MFTRTLQNFRHLQRATRIKKPAQLAPRGFSSNTNELQFLCLHEVVKAGFSKAEP